METVLAVTIGLLFAASIYLMLSPHLIRILLGIVILGNAVNLLIFTAGRLTPAVPPIVAGAARAPTPIANPVPQALVLTAIVISFGIFAFLLVLTFRAFQALKTDDVGEMRVAEPIRPDVPPVDW